MQGLQKEGKLGSPALHPRHEAAAVAAPLHLSSRRLDREHMHGVYCDPGPVLSLLQLLTPSFLRTPHESNNYYHPHFIDKEETGHREVS